MIVYMRCTNMMVWYGTAIILLVVVLCAMRTVYLMVDAVDIVIVLTQQQYQLHQLHGIVVVL